MKTQFYVSGMKCGGCASTVQQALKDAEGVESADVNLDAGEASVDGDIDPQAICLLLTEAGYPSVVKSG